MKPSYKRRMYLACLNASEMIRSHVESGLEPTDVNEKDENGLAKYGKACERVANHLNKLAEMYNDNTAIK